jgi:phosphate uptake regulator
MLYRRRVQVVGGSTYTISLPKEWVRSVGLRNGSEVVIEVMPDLTLKVYPGDRVAERLELESEVDFGGDLELAMAKLIASYVVGYRRIVVNCPNCSTEQLERIARWVTERTIGLEVIEKNQRYVVFRCLVDVSTLSMVEALSTLTKLTIRSFEDVETSITSGDPTPLDQVLERDNLIDKLYLYILRQLNQALLGTVSYSSVGLGSVAEAMYWAMIIRFLERIADCVVSIAEESRRLGPGKLLPVAKYLRLLREKYDGVSRYLLTEYRAGELAELGKLIAELRNVEAEVRGQQQAIGTANENILRISAHLRDILELLIDIHKLKELITGTST